MASTGSVRMNTTQILSEVAKDLKDNEPGHEFARWDQDQLLGYLNEGLCLVGTLNPGMRSKPTTLELVEGDVQPLQCCSRMSNVIGQVDKDGRLLAQLSKNSLTASLRWTRKPCLRDGGVGAAFRLKSYTNSATDARFFTVSPPVPFGTKVYLRVICSRTDGWYGHGDEVDEVDCGNLIAAKFWMLYRAHFVDDEKTPEYQKAMAAAKMYFQLLGLKFKADMMYEMGLVPVDKSTSFLDMSAQ